MKVGDRVRVKKIIFCDLITNIQVAWIGKIIGKLKNGLFFVRFENDLNPKEGPYLMLESQLEVLEDDKQMKKSDLNMFDIVKIRDGRDCIILPSDCLGRCDMGLYTKSSLVARLSDYTDSLTASDSERKEFDIVRVKKTEQGELLNSLTRFFKEVFPTSGWDWGREEPKEMTLGEIEEKLGHPVKIIEEKK